MEHHVKVKVLEGRSLIPGDSNGLSDPFVKLVVRDKDKKTKVIKETLDPQWNEEFDMTLPDSNINRVLAVKAEVWDKDVVGNDHLGFAYLLLNGLTKGVERRRWYKLSGVTNGKIHIGLTALDFDTSKTDIQYAETMTDDDANAWLELFYKADKNDNGTLEVKELWTIADDILKGYGWAITDAFRTFVIRTMDADGSGTIDVREYLEFHAFSKKIHEVWTALAKKESSIPVSGLKEAMKMMEWSFPENFPWTNFQTMVNLDNSSPGKVQLAAYLNLMVFIRMCQILFLQTDTKGHGINLEKIKTLLPRIGTPLWSLSTHEKDADAAMQGVIGMTEASPSSPRTPKIPFPAFLALVTNLIVKDFKEQQLQ